MSSSMGRIIPYIVENNPAMFETTNPAYQSENACDEAGSILSETFSGCWTSCLKLSSHHDLFCLLLETIVSFFLERFPQS